MKRIGSFIIISAGLLLGCHSNNSTVNTASNTTNSNASAAAPDTSKHHPTVAQIAADPNIKDGPLVKYYPNGIIKEKSYYIAGRRQGECQSFYPTGKLWSDDYFAAGLLDGSTTAYYENGVKRYEGSCSQGKQVGVWKYYDNTGKLVRSVDYSKKSDSM